MTWSDRIAALYCCGFMLLALFALKRRWGS
jgi:hypothetical protein